MILVADIGNTNIVVGIYKQKWQYIWRFTTDKQASIHDYSLKINNALWEAGIDPKDIVSKVLSSVVPELKDLFVTLLTNLSSSQLIVLDKNIYAKLPIVIPNKNEIGTDLVANVMAAHHLHKENLIIVDFGTALTFTAVDKFGNIKGINIAPGIKTAINALEDKASQLDMVPLVFPKNVLGHNTVEAIQNGVLIGYVGLVSHMILVIKQDLGQDYKVLATGGLSTILLDRLPVINYVEPNLTIDGLLLIADV